MHTDTASLDGVLIAPVGRRGRWAALCSLRQGMTELRGHGEHPRVGFVMALADDGRIVHGRHPDASLFVLGYSTG
jgi:hypothetical protein